MPITTVADIGAAARGAGVQFREFFSQNVMSEITGWEPVVKIRPTDQAVDTFSGKTGSGTLSRFAEGAAIPTLNRYKLYNTAVAMDQYGGQLSITRRMLKFRDWNDVFDEFKDLTWSTNVTLSKAPAQIFNGAFSNSGVFTLNGIRVTTYNDGKNLASTAHPRVDGGTAQSNASSSGIPFTEVNFETGRIALMEQLQDDGTPIANMGVVYVVVPPKLEKTALIITQSNQRAETANNDVNIYKGGGYLVLSSVWLGAANSGSDTAWFLVAPQASRLALVRSGGPELNQDVDKNTRSIYFSVVNDFGVCSYDWRGVWGSKGDSLSYTS